MPLRCDQPSLPSLPFTESTNYTFLPSLLQRRRNSHDKIQNADIPSKVAFRCGSSPVHSSDGWLLSIAQAPQGCSPGQHGETKKNLKKSPSYVHTFKHRIYTRAHPFGPQILPAWSGL